MIRYVVAYSATAFVMVTLDMVWLGVIAKSIYRRGIGHLMAEQANIYAAVLFYLVFALGLMVFAVSPHASAPGWTKTLVSAALFGFFAYATYDLTNLATLDQWPVGVSVLDIAWGSTVSLLSAAAGKAALDRFS